MKNVISSLRMAVPIILAATIPALPAAAVTISAGYELISIPSHIVIPTDSGYPTAWVGDPDRIGEGMCPEPRQYDFGDGNGCVSTGDASLIIRRLDEVDVDSAEYRTKLDIMAMSLVSDRLVSITGTSPIEFASMRILDGPGVTTPYGGPITVCPDPGFPGCEIPFSFMDLNVFSAATWLLAYNAAVIGETSGTTKEVAFNTYMPPFFWDQSPPPGAVLIEGINTKLNGTDTSGDFWRNPVNILGGVTLGPAVIPVPAAFPMLLLGVGAIAGVGRRRARGHMPGRRGARA